MTMRYRRLTIGVGLLLALTAAGSGGARVMATRRLQAELVQAEHDFNAGYFGLTYQRLTDLEKWWPGQDEIEFQLGVCQLARGRDEEALAAWARVKPGSEFAARAAENRARLLNNLGRYGPAEAVLDAALRHTPGITVADLHALRRAQNRLYRFEGRIADARRLLRATWAEEPRPAEILWELWVIDFSPQPIEAWSEALSKADATDDRVWLGQGVVATLKGDYAEASRRLDACLHARPDDPAVWRARLDLARASGDEAGVWQAARRVPADRLEPSEPLAVQAWLLARRDDREAERRALRTLVDIDPGRIEPLDRLAALEAAAGRRDEADRLHVRKTALDAAKDRYRKLLYSGDDRMTHAQEFSKLSAELGRTFDAWAWKQLAEGHRAGPAAVGKSALAADTGMLADRLAALGLKPPTALTAAGSSPRPVSTATPPRFTDEAVPAGLASFVFDNGRTPFQKTPETMSGGVGLLDYDGDGFLDVYAVQGGPLDGSGSGDRLFRNKGDGTFEDVTERTGIAKMPRGYGHGVAVGDIDNDGHPDIFVTRISSYALYRNRGDGTFEDITARSGLAGRRDTPSCAAFADLDGDGDLDLYVTHYMLWDPKHPPICPNEKGGYFYCDPSKLDPAPDHVFRNDGGKFVEVTKEAGFTDPDGRGLGLVVADFDGDGRVDVYVNNDGTANYLFLNRGKWHFEEVGHDAGVAGNAEGGYQASMGAACGDVDGDGLPDILITNFYGEASTYYHNLGGGLFADRTAASGLGTATRYLLGFGTALIDYDNDGILDSLTTNGHVNDNRPFYPYEMPALLLAGTRAGRFINVSEHAGGVWSIPHVGRGLAVGDIDNDGRIDAVILPQNEPLIYLHNQTESGHWLTLELEGTTSNRDAVGAVATVTTADGQHRKTWRVGGGSYQSAGDPRLHLGLGAADRATAVEVRWPSGRVDLFKDIPADAAYHLREGETSPRPLKVRPRAGTGRE